MSTIFVSKDGNDLSGNGSVDKPFESIQKAIDNAYVTAQDPVSITVRPGVYCESINISKPGITIEGVSLNDWHQVMIVAPNYSDSAINIFVDGVYLSNITVVQYDPIYDKYKPEKPEISVFYDIPPEHRDITIDFEEEIE